MRYFFHIRDGVRLDVDEEGLEVPDIDSARAEAMRTALEMLRDAVLDAARQSFEVTDENGKVVFVVPFSQAAAQRGELERGDLEREDLDGKRHWD